MNESASSTTATNSSNVDSCNFVGPLLNAETALAKPAAATALVDFNANAIVDDRDNLPTDCDDGGSDDDSFGSPLRLGKLVIDFDAGCEANIQPERATAVPFMSTPRVADTVSTGNGNGVFDATSLPSPDTMSKVEHQITNTSGNGLQVKIKRKTLVMKPEGPQQPSPAEGLANGNVNGVSTSECKSLVSNAKPNADTNSSSVNNSVAEHSAKKDSKVAKQNAGKPSGGKAAKSSSKSTDGAVSVKMESGDTSEQFGQRNSSSLTMTIVKDANCRPSSNNNKVAEGGDPYEFNAKVEDKKSVIEPTMKKVKSEKVTDSAIDPNISSSCMSVSTKSSSSSSLTRDVSVETCSVSVATDPDCLGPCDPGSHVVLEGIVWQETNNGLLVVNVTWRGKTYVGTLMDATQHDWAPPIRLSDFATVDMETKTPKGRGAKRGRGQTATPKNDANERRLRNRRIAVATATKDTALAAGANSDNNGNAPTTSDVRRKRTAAEAAASSNNGGNGHDNGEDSSSSLSSVAAATVAAPPAKQSRTAGGSSAAATVSVTTGSKFFAPDVECAALPPPQFVCSEPGCCKRYQRETALRYHQSSAHPNNAAANSSSAAAAGLHHRQSGSASDLSEKNADVDKKPAIAAGKAAPAGSSNKLPKVKVFANAADQGAATSVEGTVPMDVSVATERSLKSGSSDAMDTSKAVSSSVDAGTSRVALKDNAGESSASASLATSVISLGGGSKLSASGFQSQTLPAKDSQEVKVKVPKSDKTSSSSDKPKAKVAAIKTGATTATSPVLPSAPAAIAPARTTMLVSVTTHSQPLANLKPIQPKPTVMGEPSSVNPSLSDLKDMKAKKKKKNKDKDKDKERSSSSSGKSNAGGGASAVLPLTASGGEFAKPSSAAGSPPQVKVTPDLEAIVIGSSSTPSTPVPTVGGRQSPGFLSTSAAQDQQNSKVQSPAYSDISDANDSAPSLEQESAMDVTVGANLSGNSTDTLPLSPPLAVAMGNSSVAAAAANSRGVFGKGLGTPGSDVTQKSSSYYSEPPSLLPVVNNTAASAFAADSDPRKQQQQQEGLKPAGLVQSKSTPPLPPVNQELPQRMAGFGPLNPVLPFGDGSKRPGKTRTPPNPTLGGAKQPSTPSSSAGSSKQYVADKSGGSSGGVVGSSARPVGCAYPMHSTPNATAASAKHDRSLSADGHVRPPPMLISDRDRSGGVDESAKTPRDHSSESRQILVESVEMRSHMPGSQQQHFQQGLAGSNGGRAMMLASGGEHHHDFDGQKMAAAGGSSKDPLMRARSEDDRGPRRASRDGATEPSPYDNAKSPQSSTPKPARDVPPPPPLSSAAGGVVPYPFFPGPGFYPMMAAAGPMEGGVMPMSVDPSMYSMFAASQAAAMAAVYRYGMPVVDNSGAAVSAKMASDKQQQQQQLASPSSSAMSPDARLALDSSDSMPSSGSAGMSSHKMKELKDIANKRAEAGGSRPSSTAGSAVSSSTALTSASPSALLARPPGALLSPGSGAQEGSSGSAMTSSSRVVASPPAQRHVHEHVHHVVPSAPPGYAIYPPFGVGALMPPMHPMTAAAVSAAARMARPAVNK